MSAFIGETRFTYTESQARRIYDYLNCNDGDICKVFEIVWYEGVFSERDAPMTLCLIDRIERARKRVSSFDRFWNNETVANGIIKELGEWEHNHVL